MLAGCATPPEPLSRSRSTHQKNESSTLAAIETQDAFGARNKADQASLKDQQAINVAQLAYLANQKISLVD